MLFVLAVPLPFAAIAQGSSGAPRRKLPDRVVGQEMDLGAQQGTMMPPQIPRQSPARDALAQSSGAPRNGEGGLGNETGCPIGKHQTRLEHPIWVLLTTTVRCLYRDWAGAGFAPVASVGNR